MRKGLPILHSICMGIKKVVGRGNRLVTDRRIKMAGLDIQAITHRHISLRINLGECDTVVARRSATQIKIPSASIQWVARIDVKRRHPVCLGKNGVRAEHEIDTGSEIPGTALGHHSALYKYIELVQLRPVSLIGERDRAVEPPSLARIERCPAVNPTAYSYRVFLKKIYRRIRLSDHRVSNRYEQANRRGKCDLASASDALHGWGPLAKTLQQKLLFLSES